MPGVFRDIYGCLYTFVFVKYFMNVIHHSEFIKSLRRMFGHIGVRKNNTATIQILKKSLVMTHDTDYSIRCAFRYISHFNHVMLFLCTASSPICYPANMLHSWYNVKTVDPDQLAL